MEKNNTKWTQEDCEYLKKNYSNHGALYCSIILKRTKRAVFIRAKKMKLYVDKKIKIDLGKKYSYQMIFDAISKSKCYSDVIRNLGLNPQAGNFENIKNRINEYKIDISHFLSPGQLTQNRMLNNKLNYFVQKPLEQILIISDKRLDNRKIKKRLFNAGIKKNECEICGTGEDWYGKKLSLRLDHINGNNIDYRLENLRILCPNCDSTLDTYCSRNRVKKDKKQYFKKENRKCLICKTDFIANASKHVYCSRKCARKIYKRKDYNNECKRCKISFTSKKKNQKYCSQKCQSLDFRKVKRPSYEDLIQFIKNNSGRKAAKKFGVCESTIRRWIKQYKKQIGVYP